MTTCLHFAPLSDIHLSVRNDYFDVLASRAADFLSHVIAELNQIWAGVSTWPARLWLFIPALTAPYALSHKQRGRGNWPGKPIPLPTPPPLPKQANACSKTGWPWMPLAWILGSSTCNKPLAAKGTDRERQI